MGTQCPRERTQRVDLPVYGRRRWLLALWGVPDSQNIPHIPERTRSREGRTRALPPPVRRVDAVQARQQITPERLFERVLFEPKHACVFAAGLARRQTELDETLHQRRKRLHVVPQPKLHIPCRHAHHLEVIEHLCLGRHAAHHGRDDGLLRQIFCRILHRGKDRRAQRHRRVAHALVLPLFGVALMSPLGLHHLAHFALLGLRLSRRVVYAVVAPPRRKHLAARHGLALVVAVGPSGPTGRTGPALVLRPALLRGIAARSACAVVQRVLSLNNLEQPKHRSRFLRHRFVSVACRFVSVALSLACPSNPLVP